MELKTYLKSKKEMVDAALEDYFRNYDAPAKIKEAMLYSLRAGGKRLRPILAIAAAEACGGKEETVLSVALALEMIHTFSLIHDDLPAMDDDDLRRGMPTSHKVYGEAMAILAGDALLAEAFRCLARAFVGEPLRGLPTREGTEPLPYEEAGLVHCLGIISDIAAATGSCGMIGGQTLDIEAEGKIITSEELERLHKGKTGALITASVTSGAKAVCASEKQINALSKYGRKIGLAFQISDDILDIEGTEEEIGKPVGSDVDNKKSTYPSILGLEKSKQLAARLVDEAVETLLIFDAKADPLREIAKYIIVRKN